MSLIMSDDDARKLAATAQENFRQKKFDAAFEAFQKLKEFRPQNAHWADRYAQCEMRLKRWAEAQGAWAEVIARHGLSLGRVNSLARSFIELRNYQAAHDVLESAQDKIVENATFLTLLSVSALALGNRAAALRAGLSIEDSAGEDGETAVDSLCGHLRRLIKEGHGHDVVWLIDSLLDASRNRVKLLRLGMSATIALALFERRLFYASELVRLYPESFHENVAYLGALIDAQHLDAARAHANELYKNVIKTDQTPLDDRVFDSLQNALYARAKWQAVLHDSIEPETFFAINLRLAALLTIKAYREAITVAEQALSSHGEHPWFMSILAKANEKLGKMDVAVQCLEQAIHREPEGISSLFQLADVQIRAGNLTGAAEAAGKLFALHPRLPAALSLLRRLGQLPPDLDDVPPKTETIENNQGETWLHAGDFGDIIYALAAVRGGGGGRLFFTSIVGTREPMTAEKIAFLVPLLNAQSYVEYVAPWQGEPITRDFLVFRHYLQPGKDLATQQWQSVLDDMEPDIKTPWLTLPARERHGRPVFARSLRYRNPAWDPFWLELKKSSPDAIFVGSEDEFLEFGHGEHCLARDALELAHIINGASIFVGNQSFPYAIAEGLKVGRILEVYQPWPNCIFPGALTLFVEPPSQA